jgi:phosphoglucomutase
MDYIKKVEELLSSKKISPECATNLILWLTDQQLKDFIPALETLLDSENFHEIEDAFYSRITVGTGGIRGNLGVGPNRINIRTISEAAQALSHFIEGFGKEAIDKGVVVGYEARKFSREFATECCQIFAGNGIKAYLFDGLRSTPELSFAVRFLKTTAGVQITASHNPRTDNGFKFYWSDGGQVVPPLDQKFMDLVGAVNELEKISMEEGKKKGLIESVGEEVDKAYIKAIQGLSLTKSRSATIVFSPIHGAGGTNVYKVLKAQGFDVEMVPEQSKPDPEFPTAHGDLINPEYREVMELPIRYGEERGVDVVINSDPDADRIGVAAKRAFNSHELIFLSGNEVGVALTHFILSQRKAQGRLPKSGLVLETNVTTSLISDIAKSFNIQVKDDLLVGFKFIGEIIEKLEDKNDFIFAAEESLGYLAGTFVRDKDGAISSMLLAELVSTLKDQGKTLIDYLNEIYAEYGYYKNILNNVELKGRVGKENIAKIMKGLRSDPPGELAGLKVLGIKDRLDPEMRKPENYKVGKGADQLAFILSEDGRSKVTVRPSGTEPKIKYYIQYFGSGKSALNTVKLDVDQVARALEKEIVALGNKIIKND